MRAEDWCRQYCTGKLGWNRESRKQCRAKTSCREYDEWSNAKKREVIKKQSKKRTEDS